METASWSNGAKPDRKAEALSRLCSLDARDLEDVAIVQPYRSQFLAPYAATVDGQEVGLDVQSQGSPMSADDRGLGLFSIWNSEPRKITSGRLIRRAGEPGHLTGWGAGA